MIKIAVCDDNTIMLEKLKVSISKAFIAYTRDYDVKCLSSGALLLKEHNMEPFDIIFLDIDMPKVTGFDVAKGLRDKFSSCFIIFVTSHSELVYESMDFQPFHFIRKDYIVPLETSVSQIVKKLMMHMKQNEKVILEDDISGRCGVYIRDIIYIESNKHYMLYHLLNKELPIKMRGSLKECEEKYSNYDFVRIHKRYYINLKYLSDFDNGNDEVLLGAIHKKLPMSRNYKNNVDQKYTLYLRTTV